MKVFIAIDGACRRNGKPDCTASGGLFVQAFDDDNQPIGCCTRSIFEYGSTNQRGELLALLKALKIVWQNKYNDVTIITDSEYLFNSMTKQWYKSWQSGKWLTRDGNPVKNRDIWEQIAEYAEWLDGMGSDIIFLHIKGHCIPFGTVTATSSLTEDPTGKQLLDMVTKKYDGVAESKKALFEKASELSVKNNGFELAMNSPVLKMLVVYNVMADAIATKAVEEADSHRET